jgi:hypothetical protein
VALMPGVAFIGPTVNKTPDAMRTVYGLVLHIQQGTEAGTEAWFKDRAAKASAHFLNPKQGKLRQLVDTRDMAWAEAGGNPHWISIENEGRVPDALTDSQLENCAHLYAWLHRSYTTVPVQATDSPNAPGLGWHGMGGAAWGNHPDCPGAAIKKQRSEILTRTHLILGAGTKWATFPGARWFSMGRRSPLVAAMHERLVAVGCDHYRSASNKDVIGSGDVASYEAWQHKCGYTGAAAKWPPGKATWDRLHVPNV